MALWIPRNAVERAQFVLGFVIFVIVGPFINIGVTLYACRHMDNFGWGKTRLVVTDTPDLKNQIAHPDSRTPYQTPVL
jgi:chitin synthase